MTERTKRSIRALIAGLLVGNSAPHLASAATGREHLTPLAGRRSSGRVNLAWGSANLLGGLGLLAVGRSKRRRWDGSLLAFEAGVVAFGAWMVGSEAVTRTNSGES